MYTIWFTLKLLIVTYNWVISDTMIVWNFGSKMNLMVSVDWTP